MPLRCSRAWGLWAHPITHPYPPELDGQMRRARKEHNARAARLLTGRSGSSPPRAAGRLQRRPGHDSPPRLPAGARGLGAVRGLPSSASGARSLGPGRRARCTDPRRPAKEQRLPEWPKQGPESRPRSPGDPCGRGGTESSAARPGGSEGPRRGLAAASPGLSPGWERAAQPRRLSPPETSRPRRAQRGRA